MLAFHQTDNHVRDALHHPVGDGQTERMSFLGAMVRCGDVTTASNVSLVMRTSNMRHPQRETTVTIETPPATLRSALADATRTGQGHVVFAIEDGERFDVDADVYLREYDSAGPVTLTFLTERAAVPWPSARGAVRVRDALPKGCKHSAQSWYLKNGAIGCDDCDAAMERSGFLA